MTPGGLAPSHNTAEPSFKRKHMAIIMARVLGCKNHWFQQKKHIMRTPPPPRHGAHGSRDRRASSPSSREMGHSFISRAGAERNCALPMRLPHPIAALKQESRTDGGLGSAERLLGRFQTPVQNLHWIAFNLRRKEG